MNNVYFYLRKIVKRYMSRSKQADATFAGMFFLGLAIVALLGNKISGDIQAFIVLFFMAGGYFLAYHPRETKKIAGAFADVVIAVINVLKKIILTILNR